MIRKALYKAQKGFFGPGDHGLVARKAAFCLLITDDF